MDKNISVKARKSGYTAAAKIVFALYFLVLAGLLFVPSLFSTSAGIGFTGGKSLFAFFKDLFLDLLKKPNDLSAFGSLVAIKWHIAAIAAVIIINLIGLFLILFSKSKKSVNTLFIIFMLISMIVIGAVAAVYKYRLPLTAQQFSKTVVALYFYSALLFTFILALVSGGKNAVIKGFIYLVSASFVAALIFKTFDFGAAALEGLYSVFLPKFLSKTYVNGLEFLTSFMASGSTIFGKILIYGFTALVSVCLINLIISVLTVKSNKVTVFDIVRFIVQLVIALVVAAVVLLKFKEINFFKSYGLLGFVFLSAVLVALSIVGKCCGKRVVKVAAAKNDDSTIDLSNLDTEIPLTFIAEPALESVEQPVMQPKAVNEKSFERQEKRTQEPISIIETEADDKADGQLKMDLPNETVKETEKIDIEELKQQIISEIYSKEKTETMTDDSLNLKPAAAEVNPYRDFIEEENNYKQQEFDIPSQQPSYDRNKFSTLSIPNPYAQKKAGSYNDRFFDSLTYQEKEEFDNIFIKNVYGENKRLPKYVVGEENKEFFSKVFIFIGRYRSIISENLLAKIYYYSTLFN